MRVIQCLRVKCVIFAPPPPAHIQKQTRDWDPIKKSKHGSTKRLISLKAVYTEPADGGGM